MAPYTPNAWVNDGPPALSANHLNKLCDELVLQATDRGISHSLPTWADGVAPALTDAAPLNEMERVSDLVAASLGLTYNPTSWASGWTPARNAARLNVLEQQAVASRSAIDAGTTFNIPTYQVTGQTGGGDVFNQGWILVNSPTTAVGSWGSIPARQLRTPYIFDGSSWSAQAQGSWEWWCLFEFYLPSGGWPVSGGGTYALPHDWHNVPGDTGWSDGSGVSSLHTKLYPGGTCDFLLQHERDGESGGPGDYTIRTYSQITTDVWHSVAIYTILGRKDFSVAAPNHPNSGNGRTRVYWDGAQVLDTGNINILERRASDGRIQSKMTILEGLYASTITGQHQAQYTIGRFGSTMAEAQADSAIVVQGIAGDTGNPAFVRIADRSSSNFISP